MSVQNTTFDSSPNDWLRQRINALTERAVVAETRCRELERRAASFSAEIHRLRTEVGLSRYPRERRVDPYVKCFLCGRHDAKANMLFYKTKFYCPECADAVAREVK